MKPYNNPKIYLANLVKFEYDKAQKKYVPLILNAKIPVVLILGSGYFTESNNVFNSKCSMPLNLINLDNYGKVKTNKYYITNANPLSRYTDNENSFLSNLNISLLKINNRLNCDGNWYKKDDIVLDKGFSLGTINFNPDMKLDDEIFVAKRVTKIKRFEAKAGYLDKDEYLHFSKNYGLFSVEKGIPISLLTGYSYSDLSFDDLKQIILSFELDKSCITYPITTTEEIGIYGIDDLHSFIAMHKLYIDPRMNILDQINSYQGLANPINIRDFRELYKLGDSLSLSKKSVGILNKEIMQKTLHK